VRRGRDQEDERRLGVLLSVPELGLVLLKEKGRPEPAL